MKRLFAEFRLALRRGIALFFFRRRSPNAPAPRPSILLLLGVLWLSAFAGVSWLWAGADPAFNEWGLNSVLSSWCVFLIAIILFSRGVRRAPLARAFADVLSIGAIVFLFALALAVGARYAGIGAESTSSGAVAIGLASLVLYGWQLAAIARAGRSVFPATVKRPGLKLLAAALLPILLVPDRPLIRGEHTPDVRVDVWSWADTYRTYFPDEEAETEKADSEPVYDYEGALYRQPAMVAAALDKIAPSSGSVPQFYFVGVAPSSYHSVFKREVESARSIFAERFNAADRSMSLITDVDTWDRVPLANMTNLARVLDGVGQKMDKDRDVLVLFLTSHGSKDEVQVYFEGANFNTMTGKSLAEALDASGIKNRVVIVSACHSGSLIPALEGPDTLVLTAAHADKTSFGCSNDRDWTYFGDAYFNHALRETHSFTEAFDKAKALISKWETEKGFIPSEPQMSAGKDIVAKLDQMTVPMAVSRQAGADAVTPSSP